MDKQKTIQKLIDAMGNLEGDQILAYSRDLVEAGATSFEIISYLNTGLKQVGEYFEKGEYFIADLMVSGVFYRKVLDLFTDDKDKGPTAAPPHKVIIGVVEDDFHDIGKDIVISVLQSENYDVTDLGCDVKPQAFVDAIRQTRAPIVLLSGMMRFAEASMKNTIDAITEAGLRDQVYIIIGGGCVNKNTARRVGADAGCTVPMETVQYCNQYFAKEHG